MLRILTLATCLFAFSAFAADAAKDAKPDPKMMEAFKKMATPSEGHKVFADMTGKWTYTSKMWMTPDAKPEEMKGTTTAKLIMGDRFLQQEVKGKHMGQPFTGMAIMGYNNMKNAYETIWIDNMSTGMAQGQGTFDTAAKTIKEEGKYSCPMTNQADRSYRAETRFIDKNSYVYEMYNKGPDGKEFKTMEMTYKRATGQQRQAAL